MATGQANGGLWLSAAELAAERGVSRSAITQNLRRWAERGAPVATRRRGRELLVNVAAYDAKHGSVADQLRVQDEVARRARRRASPKPARAAKRQPPGDDPILAKEQARKMRYE